VRILWKEPRGFTLLNLSKPLAWKPVASSVFTWINQVFFISKQVFFSASLLNRVYTFPLYYNNKSLIMITLRTIKAKAFATVAALLLFTGTAVAQDKEEILVVADVMPMFPGGPKVLMETIQKSITYPQDAFDSGIQGKVILKFAVNKEGKAILPSIVKGLSPSIDRVVLGVVDKLPRFEPAKNAGQPVSVWYAVPVSFTIKEQ
jgi:TonB family protein